MTIRPATFSDIPVLRNLANEIWHAHYPGIITTEQIEFMLGWMYSEAEIARQLEFGPRWEIIELKGEPVAFTSYGLEVDCRVKLHKLYVSTAHQGKGLGCKILEHITSEATKLGGLEVWLQVNKRNSTAISAYRKAGFQIVSDAVFDIGHGFVMDDYVMAKPVSVA